VHIYPSVRIAIPWNLDIGSYTCLGDGAIVYSLGRIAIGSNVTISQYAHLCAGSHDYSRPEMPLIKLPISIGAEAWICADAFIGPGVTVGTGAIVAARAVVVNDVMEKAVVAGNPARTVGLRKPNS
jgi:putative colanic acid biosynthesis acetyltransferase WcaF